MLKRDSDTLLPIVLIWSLLSTLLYAADYLVGLGFASSIFTFDILVTPLFMGAVTALALSDRNLDMGRALSAAFGRFWPIIVCYILGYIGVMVGLLLLIIPGLVLSVFWCLSFPILMSESKGPIQALEQSYRRVGKAFFSVARLVVGYFLLVVAAHLAMSLLGLGSISGEPGVGLAIETTIGTALSVIVMYLNVAIYYEFEHLETPDVSAFD